MASIISLFVVVTVALLITRVGTVAFVLTGMSRDSARFQARSAFLGVGFTTSESEDVVSHPVRRRIVMILMLLGNAGLATAVATLLASFTTSAGTQDMFVRILYIIVGLALLWLVAASKWVDRYLSRLIAWALQTWTDLDVNDYATLLQFDKGYGITEIIVHPENWLCNKTLIQLALPDEGIMVLSIRRKTGHFLGAPTGNTLIHPGDTVILYGPAERIREIDHRRADTTGTTSRTNAIQSHRRRVNDETSMDRLPS